MNTMIRSLILVLLALAFLSPLQAGAQDAESGAPARLSILVFSDGRPLQGVEIGANASAAGVTNVDGAARLQLPAGPGRIELLHEDVLLLDLQLTWSAGESAQLIVTANSGQAPRYRLESSHQGNVQQSTEVVEVQDPGRLEGRIVNIEDGTPIVGARVFVSGTATDLQTDAEGRYALDLSPGSYSISVIAPQFATQTLDAVEIETDQLTVRDVELTPAGLELPDFIVLEPYIEGSLASFVEERRTSSAVSDILGAEQISRAGDSSAAGALRRVTGLTLVDGKFIFVRGLGERYSSALLNGAQVPSPDQTRRVVPLDLFPTEVLSGIVVQKTYSADMPGEFGGGTIQLRTRGVPEEFTLRVQLSSGYSEGTTGKKGLRYSGGSQDWLGRDDGTRAAPEGVLGVSLPPPRSEENAVIGRALASTGFGTRQPTIGPNTGLSAAVGNSRRFGNNDDWSLGFISSFSLSQSWDTRSQNRRLLTVLGDGTLDEIGNLDRESTERAIDSGLFLTVGAELGPQHRITGTVMRLGQTTDDTQVSTGVSTGGNFEQRTILEWIENTLLTKQISGEHSWTRGINAIGTWQYTTSRATRDSPNRRDYRFQLQEFPTTGFVYEQIELRFDELIDDVDEAQVGLRLPFEFGEGRALTVLAGASQLDRERDSKIYRFRYRGVRPPGILPVDEVFAPENISPTGLFVQASGTATDFYSASQQLDAEYLAFDGSWGAWRAYLGARREANLQEVVTLNPFSAVPRPEVGRIDTRDTLPSASLTWAYSDAAQLRFGISETVSRPDFRELSRAPFTDPVLDLAVFGNPDLQPASIRNIDLRWEYYFSEVESVSVALFQKQFDSPIELVRVPGTGELATLANAVSADNRGIEFDVYKNLGGIGRWSRTPRFLARLPWQDLFLSANYAFIESSIDLGTDSNIIVTNTDRPLQGQSPYVTNFSLSYQPEDGGMEATLLFNVFGRRISEVGVLGLPDVYEQPFRQLDFNIRGDLPWEGWRYRFRVRNLLDPDSEFTQGSEVLRTSRKGRDVSLAIQWNY